MEKIIKNVDEHSWLELKGEAARHRLKISEFLGYLVKEHKRIERKKNNAWNYVLRGGKRLSDADAMAIRKTISTFEHGYNFEE